MCIHVGDNMLHVRVSFRGSLLFFISIVEIDNRRDHLKDTLI
jgi:hypothetical protein